jgi:hypothetical protein
VGRPLTVVLVLLVGWLAAAAPAHALVLGAEDEAAMEPWATNTAATLAVAHRMGATVWRYNVRWREVQTSPGHYDTAGVRHKVAAARRAGMRVLLTLGGGPANPPPPSAGTLARPHVGAYLHFVRAVVRATRGKVAAYTLGNEPNWSRMSPCHYRELYTQGRRTIRSIVRRPVLWGDFADGRNRDYTLRALACDPQHPIVSEGFAIHPYGDPADRTPRQGAIADVPAMHRWLVAHRAQLHTPSGATLPLYATEMGFKVHKWPDRTIARKWLDALRLLVAGHVRWCVVYVINDPGPHSWNTSILHPDGTPRPQFYVLRHFADRGRL